jgi:hypothetical protein
MEPAPFPEGGFRPFRRLVCSGRGTAQSKPSREEAAHRRVGAAGVGGSPTGFWVTTRWCFFSYQGRATITGFSYGDLFCSYQPARFALVPPGLLGWHSGRVGKPQFNGWRFLWTRNPTGDCVAAGVQGAEPACISDQVGTP